MWKEFLDADTLRGGPGSPVSPKVLDGTPARLPAQRPSRAWPTPGRDANWTGHDFAQANWYAYGRLAWNPALGAADDRRRVDSHDVERANRTVVAAIRTLMLGSRETYVDYTMPLGLHHLIGGDHYAPMPENADPRRLDWSAIYYHRADAEGIGFDRTRRGSGAVDQYRPPLNDRWNDPARPARRRCLLWFHRLPWDYRGFGPDAVGRAGAPLHRRRRRQARAMENALASARGQGGRRAPPGGAGKLQRQAADAAAWRDQILEVLPASADGL